MKKSITLFIALLVIANVSFSQVAAGLNFIGGSFSVDYKYRAAGVLGGENKITFVPIVVNYGKFITPHLAVGVGIGYTYYTEFRQDENKDSTYYYNLPTYTFVPQAKYFFPIFTSKFYLVANLNLSYGIQSLKINLDKPSGKELIYKGSRFIMDLNIRPSLVYFIHKRFALEGTFGYFGYNRVLRSDSKGTAAGSKNDYNLKFSFDPSTITIGINYFFPGRDKTRGKDEK